jgi:hypothetical protein
MSPGGRHRIDRLRAQFIGDSAELVVWQFSEVVGRGKCIEKWGGRRHSWNTFARFPVLSQRSSGQNAARLIASGLIGFKAKSIPFNQLGPKCGIRNWSWRETGPAVDVW